MGDMWTDFDCDWPTQAQLMGHGFHAQATVWLFASDTSSSVIASAGNNRGEGSNARP